MKEKEIPTAIARRTLLRLIFTKPLRSLLSLHSQTLGGARCSTKPSCSSLLDLASKPEEIFSPSFFIMLLATARADVVLSALRLLLSTQIFFLSLDFVSFASCLPFLLLLEESSGFRTFKCTFVLRRKVSTRSVVEDDVLLPPPFSHESKKFEYSLTYF